MPLEVVAETPPEREVRRVGFMGAEFAVADKIGLMPLMRFAKIAKSGVDSADEDGLAAMYDLLQQCIADEDWGKFEAHADKTRADDEELMQVVKDVMAILSERPTRRPSDSSPGPQSTTPISAEDSSALEVVQRLKSQGRPDLAMAVLRQQTG
jgi:hypothetical protein